LKTNINKCEVHPSKRQMYLIVASIIPEHKPPSQKKKKRKNVPETTF